MVLSEKGDAMNVIKKFNKKFKVQLQARLDPGALRRPSGSGHSPALLSLAWLPPQAGSSQE